MQAKDIMITEEYTVNEAMQQLDKVAYKILYVMDGLQLKATLTDGDIRRYILANGNVLNKVDKVANYNPQTLLKANRQEAINYLNINRIDSIPSLNEVGEIEKIYFLNYPTIYIEKKELKLPVVIMAGGEGKRLYPYTNILPKPLIPIGDIPILERVMNQFNEFGCDKFYPIVNHKKNMIKAYFNEIPREYEVEFIDEDKPLGTGGGLLLAKDKIDSTFILSNCDILIDEDFEKIYENHKEHNNTITMICAKKNIEIPYGVVEKDDNDKLISMSEKPQINFLTNTGCYIVEKDVFDLINCDENIGFPDIIDRCKQRGMNIGVYQIDESKWLDMGQLEELQKMKEKLNLDKE